MVVTRAWANRQMEEELATLKTKFEDLNKKFLGLHLQHSTMNNRWQPKSYANIGFSSSSNFHGPKLDFPRFNGDDPTGSIYKEEQYFILHNTFDFNKFPLAVFHLEHEALQWFYWYIKDHEEHQWTYFFQLLLQQFGPSAFDDFTGTLTKLRQTDSVREY